MVEVCCSARRTGLMKRVAYLFPRSAGTRFEYIKAAKTSVGLLLTTFLSYSPLTYEAVLGFISSALCTMADPDDLHEPHPP